MKSVKKVLNIEYDLSSTDFIAQKQDSVSQEYQDRHPNDLVKVTTFCVPDKAIVVSTTQENVDFMGAASKMLATRPLADQSILTLDDEMLKTYEITITAGTDLPDYVTAINVAQAKADEMFEDDDSKIPLVTVIDYRWGNVPATVSATIFGGLIGNSDTAAENVSGDANTGENYKEVIAQYGYPIDGPLDGADYYWSFSESGNADTGDLNWTLKGDAKIENEWLVVNGNDGIAQLDDMGNMHVHELKATFMIDTLEGIEWVNILSTRSDNDLSRMCIYYKPTEKLLRVSTKYDEDTHYRAFDALNIELYENIIYSVEAIFSEDTATIKLNETVVAEDIEYNYDHKSGDDIDYAVIGAYKNSGGYKDNQFFGKVKDLSFKL